MRRTGPGGRPKDPGEGLRDSGDPTAQGRRGTGSGRQIRQKSAKMREGARIQAELAEALLETDSEETLRQRLGRIPPQAATRALLAFLSSAEEALRSRSARALGLLVAQRAASDLEGAREIVRRLVWSLNDESGGIGWGAPAALAHILARSDPLCGEFAAVFVSYLREDGNFLGGSPLEPLLLDAAAILAEARPEALRSLGAERLLSSFLHSPRESSRSRAARALEILNRKLQGATVPQHAGNGGRGAPQGVRPGISDRSR